MTRLYLNGKLCNGSGRGRDEYTLSELKQIAKDNNVFVFSVSTKEDICKEIIKHHKKTKQPIVISPKIAKSPKPISVEPVVVKAKTISKKKSEGTNITVSAAKKAADKATIQLEDTEAKYRAELENLKILASKRDKILSVAAFTTDKKERARFLANDEAIEKTKEKTIERARKAKAKFEEATQVALEKYTKLKQTMTKPETSSKKVSPKPKEPKNECIKYTNKKYSERPSPPYSANECRDKVLLGNDGYQYISKPSSNGIYRWIRV
jgi:hypothetical protein